MKPTKPEKNRINLQVISIVCLGLCISISLFFVIRGYETAKTENDFKLLALDRANSIGREIENNEEALNSIYSLFSSSEYVTRDGFSGFCKNILSYHTDIQALEWIPRISNQQREDHELMAQADGYPDYQIARMLSQGGVVRADEGEEYFPVYYVEPYIGNEVAMGFDLSTNQERFEALCLSRDIGKAVGTSRITLVQEEGNQYGFLIFVPVYHKQASIDTIEERRANLTGLVSGVFRVGDLVEETLGYLKGQGVDVYLFDTSNPQDVQFLYYHPSRLGHDVNPPLSLEEIKSEGLYVSTILNVAGRKWSIVCKPAPGFMKKRYIWYPWGFLIGGLLLTGFIVVCFYTISDRASQEKKAKEMIQALNESLEQRVIERTADVAKLSQAIKFSSATVVITDTEGNIEYTNPRFAQLTGYSIEDAIGKNPRILQSGKTPPEVYKELWSTIKSGNVWNGEICNKKRSGELYWETVSISPVKDDKGTITNFIAVKDDVTERKQAEEALIQSENRYRTIVQNAHVCIHEIDLSGRITSMNPAGLKMVDASEESMVLGRPYLDAVCEKDRQRIAGLMAQALNGLVSTFEFEMAMEDGPIYIASSFIPIANKDDQVLRLMGISSDITERKKAEEKIKRDQVRFIEAEKLAHLGAWEWNLVDNTEVWSDEQFRIFGYEPGEIVPTYDHFLKALHPHDYERVVTAINNSLESSSQYKIEFRIILPDGTQRNVSAQGNVYPDTSGKPVRMMGMVLDITEHKKMEEEIVFNAERFERWKSSNFIGIIQSNAKGGISDANDALLRMIGYSRQDLIDGSLDWSKLTPPEFLHLDKNAMKEAEDKGFWTPFEKEYFHKDGHRVPIIIGGSIFKESPDEYIVFIVDIAERKKMEKVLLQSEKLKSIGTITAGISHEFNNLLAIISGNVQLLEEDYKDDKVLADALRIIMKAADDGAEIAGNMLKFTKTSPDTKKFVSFDIRDLIRHSIDFTKPRWQNEALAGGIDYRIDTEGMGRVPSIMCNPAEIREVFINIINNALDAMSGGGKISFGTWSDNETVFVNVTDDGDGISDNVKKNIFDPFFTTKGVEGTGLGMSIVYGIVTRHSGKIEVDGELGKGTAFTMQFPVTIKRRRVIKISAPEQKTNEKSLRILVIDDEESMRDILNQFLSKGGHDVKTTDNGVNVINMIEGERFDLVLCDIAMPNICGYDVVKSLNGLKKRPKIGIISGWSGSLASMADKGLTVDFFLKKPFKHEALAKYINDLEFKC